MLKFLSVVFLAGAALGAQQTYGPYPGSKQKLVVSALSDQGFTNIETITINGIANTTYEDGQPALEVKSQPAQALGAQTVDTSTPTPTAAGDPAAEYADHVATLAALDPKMADHSATLAETQDFVHALYQLQIMRGQ